MSLEQYKEEFERDYVAQEAQRDAANEDMRFVHVDGGQWEGWLEDEQRTKLEFDLTSEYVDRFIGEQGLSEIDVRYAPAEGDGSDEDAELLAGLWRKDFRAGMQGELSTGTAIAEAVTCGYGAFRLTTVPVDEEDPESKLRIAFRSLHSAHATVVWDSGAREQDKSDAQHCTVLIPYTRKGFEAAWPGVTPVSMGVRDRSHFNWVTKDTIYVGERYHVKRRDKHVFVFADLTTGQKVQVDRKDFDDVRDELERDGFEVVAGPKKIRERYVEKVVFHGNGVLEPEKRLAGKHIPVIPIYAKRGFVDGQEWYAGMVRKNKDPQRIFNLQVSSVTDQTRESNKRKPVFDPSQVQGLTDQFGKDPNTVPFYQVRALRDDNGNVVQTGPLGFIDGPELDPNSSTLLQLTSQFIDRKTGQVMRDVKDPDASGEAIREARKEVDISTIHYTRGIRLAMKRAGEVYRWMAAEVYADQRKMVLPNEDGSERTVTLMSHVIDEDTGNLVPVNDISKGEFAVVVKLGQRYESQREATVETLKEILGNLAQGNMFEAPVMATLMANLPGVGIEALRDMANKQMVLMGLKKPETDEEKQLVAQAQQEHQDEQEQLLAAAAEEQRTQAEKNRASAVKDLTTAELNRAKTVTERAKVVDIREGLKERRLALFQSAIRG